MPLILLTNMVQKDPSVIIKPIAQLLGYVMNFFFNIASSFSPASSLGISIILLTILTRFLILPLGLKSQKSMMKMAVLAPEMEKIKKKYEDKKDSENVQKMNQEVQTLYAKNGVNPLGGCLPLLIQFPVFIALSYIMQQSFLFITKLGEIYTELANFLLTIPSRWDYLVPIALEHLPKKVTLDLSNIDDLRKVINKFSPDDWTLFMSQIPAEYHAGLQRILLEKQGMEFFGGINLVANADFTFPSIIIPILSVVFSFLSAFFMYRQSLKNPMASSNPQMKTQQQMMLVLMPVMTGVMSFQFTAGVGLYWAVSSIFGLGQQLIFNRMSNKMLNEPPKLTLVKGK
ncbi:hypothetical protein AGMMS49975_11480 [Clostridia bacterium]|nr:hypothetical protein AGMMS49975_11480 [Clostridia bacterium]